MMSNRVYDAIVVGSGATGGFAAKELTERGLSVLLLEAGPAHGKAAYAPLESSVSPPASSLGRVRAALRGQHVQAMATFFSERAGFLFVNDRKNPYTCDPKHFYLWIRGRQLGGRFLTFGRVLPRWSDYDFKAASRDGWGEDWPISYDDLRPYYDRVEEFLGIVGIADHIANMPDGKFIAEAGMTTWERDLKAKIETKWPERRVTPWRFLAASAYRDHVPTTILAARATGRLEFRTGAVVRRVVIDKNSGRASGVSYVDAKSRELATASAGVVVLCASAIESVRILLNSACRHHPNGVGNSSGVLGRYFMDQSLALAFGRATGPLGWEKVDDAYGDSLSRNPGGIYIPRYQNLDRRTHPQFKRGFNIQGAVGRMPVADGSPPGFGFTAHGEMLPQFENTVTIDRTRKDAWGIPAAHIRCAPSDNELKMLRTAMDDIKELVALNGYHIEIAGSYLGIENPENLMPQGDWLTRLLFRRTYRKTLGIGACIHECGGARMGAHPSKSVLNKRNQLWDVSNIFVTDPSCFVTGGTSGPTLTAMALTVRACEFISGAYGGGG